MTQFTLNLETIDLNDEQYFQLCQNNPDLKDEPEEVEKLENNESSPLDDLRQKLNLETEKNL